MKKFKRRHKLLIKENIKINKPYELAIYRHDTEKHKEHTGGIFFTQQEWEDIKEEILLFTQWWLDKKDANRTPSDLDII